MKSLLLTFTYILVAGITFAGNADKTAKEHTHLISGKVIDKVNGEVIAGAEIKIADKTIYTDLNGNFMAVVPSVSIAAKVSFVSYNETTVTIEPFAYNDVLIALESK